MLWYLKNIIAGLRIALFLPQDEKKIHVSAHSLFAVILTILIAQGCVEYLLGGTSPSFNAYGWHHYHSALLVFMLLAGYFTAVLCRDLRKVMHVLTLFYYSYLPVVVGYFTLYAVQPDWFDHKAVEAIDHLVLIWAFLVMFRIVFCVYNPHIMRQTIACLITVGALYAVNMEFGLSRVFYYSDGDTAQAREVSPFDKLTAEELFTNQDELLSAALDPLPKSRKRTVDLYGVSFGSYRHQDVFMKEARFASAQMEDILKATDKTVTLVNNDETALDAPLASGTNLARTLNHISTLIQPKEDIVIMYFTSHGSIKVGLSVDLDYRHSLQNLSGERLAKIIEDSGIQNRVLIISACFSGAMIPFLEDDNTMIITASADNKQSYGCSDDAELTYFAKAFLQDALSETTDLEKAYELAVQHVEKREHDEKLKELQNMSMMNDT